MDGLVLIANFSNVIVMLLRYNRAMSLFACMIVIQLYALSMTTRPSQEIVIVHLGNAYRHFIRLDLEFGTCLLSIVF